MVAASPTFGVRAWGEQLTGLADARLGFARQSFAHRRQLLEPAFVCEEHPASGRTLRGTKSSIIGSGRTADCDCVNRGHKAIPLFRETTQRVAYAVPNWREGKGKGKQCSQSQAFG